LKYTSSFFLLSKNMYLIQDFGNNG